MSIQPMGASNIVAPKTQPMNNSDVARILENKVNAELAKAKPRQDRTVEDKIAIAKDVVSHIPGPVVCHANGVGANLNTLA